ncbi:MAG: UTP--glucose-1-phosphate uridylyltransferase [Thermodesulfobacteriota bacterium]
MADTSEPKFLPAFVEKMEKEGLPRIVIDTFAHYYRKVVTGETGMIPDREIESLGPEDIERRENLDGFTAAGEEALSRTVMIVLNGGLGTSMGLTGPKSLLEVKDGKSFLEILLNQAARTDVTLALMNSFSTHEETLAAIQRIQPAREPVTFLQHKFPKILQESLAPAEWPEDRELEWNPPGHGDIYTALKTSGMMEKLLDQGVRYAFIANSDNLGATMDTALLGYFADKGFPFMMEVAERTPADVKGGHLARHKDGYLVLRESAQCPDDEMDAFTDINRYRYFNTNNLWVNLEYLKGLIEREKTVRLPMILNPKTLDPRDENSPPVYQVETAMGAAVSLFEGATAVRVDRKRFFPVKKCNDLLAVRSDYFLLTEEGGLALNPARRTDTLKILLDPRFYKKIDQFDARFPQGPPSLVECESLTVEGDIQFEGGISVIGHTTIAHDPPTTQAIIPSGTRLEGDIRL